MAGYQMRSGRGINWEFEISIDTLYEINKQQRFTA